MHPIPAEPKSLVGYTIGKCKLLNICGRGAMGTVYRGMHGGLDIEVAVKVLPPHLGANPNLVERFLREAKLAAKLNHANTVRVYDVGDEAGYYYLVMEFVEGTDALELVRTHGPQEAAIVADIGAGAARALSSAHLANVIHRDVKPANLMLPSGGGVKVADFGLARALTSESGLTMTGAIMGTPDYMAPEQAQGAQVGPKADVYSLGATLYHLFVGRPPFVGANPMAVALQHVTNRIVVPEERVTDDTSQKLTRIIHEMTQKDPQKRPGDLDMIATRLADIARLNKRTRKMMFEGATLFATAGVQLDAAAINRGKAEAAQAQFEQRQSNPNLQALRKAAEKARAGAPTMPSSSTSQIQPGSGVRRRSSSEIKALPREEGSGVRRQSQPVLPTAEERPASSSRRSKVIQTPEQVQDSAWEEYSAKAFPTFQKDNILDGSAGNRAAAAEHSSWDGSQPASGSTSRPDFSRPIAHHRPVVAATRLRGSGGGLGLFVALLVIAGCAAAGWYFFVRDDSGPRGAGQQGGDLGLVRIEVSHFKAGDSPLRAATPARGVPGWFAGAHDGALYRFTSGSDKPAASTRGDNVAIIALACSDKGQLATLNYEGKVAELRGENLMPITAMVGRFPGATALAYHGPSGLLLIGDNQGRIARSDDGRQQQVFDGDAITAMGVFGKEIWVASGRSLRKLEMKDGVLKTVEQLEAFGGVISGFAHCAGRSYAVTPIMLQAVTAAAGNRLEFAISGPVATATQGYVVAASATEVFFLQPGNLEIAGRAALPLKENCTAIVALPGENAVAITTDHGNVIICRAQ